MFQLARSYHSYDVVPLAFCDTKAIRQTKLPNMRPLLQRCRSLILVQYQIQLQTALKNAATFEPPCLVRYNSASVRSY